MVRPGQYGHRAVFRNPESINDNNRCKEDNISKWEAVDSFLLEHLDDMETKAIRRLMRLCGDVRDHDPPGFLASFRERAFEAARMSYRGLQRVRPIRKTFFKIELGRRSPTYPPKKNGT